MWYKITKQFSGNNPIYVDIGPLIISIRKKQSHAA